MDERVPPSIAVQIRYTLSFAAGFFLRMSWATQLVPARHSPQVGDASKINLVTPWSASNMAPKSLTPVT